MMKNRKLVKGIALAAVITALAAGGTAAYLTDFETATNSFTVGKVDIDLDEPNWKPEDNTDLVPTQVIRKDPYVANKGVNEAFVYLEVSVPVRNVITVAKDGTRNALAKTELFSFTKNKDWTQLERTEVGQNMVYTYAYNHILKPGTKTTTLFDTVALANIIEGQLDTQQIDMPVRAYAIQATNTGDDKTTVLEQATAAYQKYVNQNKGQAGGVTQMNKLKTRFPSPDSRAPVRNRDCGVFFRLRKKDKFCCSGVCDNGDRGRFSGSYTYAYGEWSILQKRDPDRKFFRQCERVPGRLLCEDVPFLLQ